VNLCCFILRLLDLHGNDERMHCFNGTLLRLTALIGALCAGLPLRIVAQTHYELPYSFSTFLSEPEQMSFLTPAPATVSKHGLMGSFYEINLAPPTLLAVAADKSGDLYASSGNDTRIWKISSVGAVTAFAGMPRKRGSIDGFGAAALFDNPGSLAVDQAGNIYVANLANNTVRKLTPEGNVTTLTNAASEINTEAGHPPMVFPGLCGIATDFTGNIYVATSHPDSLQKISTTGSITTIWKNGESFKAPGTTGNETRIVQLGGIAADPDSNIYILDPENNSSDGSRSVFAGLAGASGSSDGIGGAARFNHPEGIAVDRLGNIYLADCGNHAIRMISPSQVVTTLGGMPGEPGDADGIGNAARFSAPIGIAGCENGVIYVLDPGNKKIVKGVPIRVRPNSPKR